MKAQKMALILALATTGLAFGQSAAEQIKKLENQWTEASLENDIAALEKILADAYTSTDSEGTVSTKARPHRLLKLGDEVIAQKLSDMKVRFYGDTAIATGIATNRYKYTLERVDRSAAYRFTDVWVKHGGSWHCVAEHSSKLYEKVVVR